MAPPALTHCGQLVKTFDYDRFLACLFAPAACREALWALYAFDLELARVRNAVREPMLGRIRLQWWRETIAGVYRDGQAREPVSQAIAAAVLTHRLSAEPLQQIIDSHETDLCEPAPDTVDALLQRQRASSVPLVNGMLEILGTTHPATAQAAQAIGLASALVRLIRAAPQQNSHAGPELTRAAELAHLAAGFLSEARSADVIFDRQSRAALLPATLIANDLARLARSQYEVRATAAAQRSPAVLLKLALRAALGRY